MRRCDICPRHCGADRDESLGFCGAPSDIYVSRVALHKWEEPPISGKRGSGTIFFTGCNLCCVYCQNCAINGTPQAFVGAKKLTAAGLCDAIKALEDAGAHNINFVTPTHYAAQIKEALMLARPRIPVVYNTSGYESVETLKSLESLVDIYLPDLKYFSSELSAKYSNAPDYFSVAFEAIGEMHRQVGRPVFDADGMMRRGVIVRHLVLPGCRRDSFEILEKLASHFSPEDIKLSLMRQYTPEFADSVKYPELSRRVTTFEYESVVKKAASLGFDGYIQGADSATSKYTPDFNTAEAFLGGGDLV